MRYTRQPVHVPVALPVQANGMAVTFAEPLDDVAARDLASYSMEQWNHLCSGGYGPPEISAADPKKKSRDKVEVKATRLSADKKTVLLEMAVKPVMQMKIKFTLKAADGSPINQEIYNTTHKVPSQRASVR